MSRRPLSGLHRGDSVDGCIGRTTCRPRSRHLTGVITFVSFGRLDGRRMPSGRVRLSWQRRCQSRGHRCSSRAVRSGPDRWPLPTPRPCWWRRLPVAGCSRCWGRQRRLSCGGGPSANCWLCSLTPKMRPATTPAEAGRTYPSSAPQSRHSARPFTQNPQVTLLAYGIELLHRSHGARPFAGLSDVHPRTVNRLNHPWRTGWNVSAASPLQAQVHLHREFLAAE